MKHFFPPALVVLAALCFALIVWMAAQYIGQPTPEELADMLRPIVEKAK
jgi:galactose-1-phosphate uridylyltransferase